MSRIKASADPKQLTKRASVMLAALGNGQTLCVKNARALDKIGSFEARAFWLEPSGKSAAPTAVEELIRKGRIVASEDGLFEGYSQTWRAA